MRGIVVRAPGGLDRLELIELPEPPPPGRGEIMVRVHATSLNYRDYAIAAGMARLKVDRIPMADAGGEVLAVGDGVTGLSVGDRVVSIFFPSWLAGPPAPRGVDVPGDSADGYAREIVTVPATNFVRAPVGYSHEEAATLTCAGVTAWRALMADGPLLPGETVLVQGTGGVSVFALQLAKLAGARVIATSSSDEKLERMRALGADHTINYRADPNWGETARGLTELGVDHVVEIGGAGTLPQSIAACAFGGHIALIGVLAGRAGEVPTALLMHKQVRLQGLTVGSRKHLQDLVRAIDASGLRPVIDSVFPLVGMADAFRHQESGTHFGKICVRVSEG